MIGIAVAAFIAIFAFDIPFPLIILTAALIGYCGGRAGSKLFQVGGGHGKSDGSVLEDKDSALGETVPDHARPNLAWSLKVGFIFAALWLIPIAALLLILGPDNVFSEIALFFSKMAVMTFGGAYAVLSYVAQEAIQNYGWLEPGEMLDGLGMAETTPGPLIQVVQYVGFLGAYREAGGLSPLLAATLASVLTTWVTFVPCFLWIFLGAPFIEKLRDNKALSGAMSAITAAVVGVVLNLGLWFAIHVLFAQVVPWQGLGMHLDIPVWQTLDMFAFALTAGAIVAVFYFRTNMLLTLLACAVIGFVAHL